MSTDEQSSLDDGRITFDREEPPLTLMQRDPVCGMEVEPATAAASREYRGTTYYFCSTACRDTFDASSARYVG
jgi:YHS domain-containing protein